MIDQDSRSPAVRDSIETSRAQKALLVFFGFALFLVGLVVVEGLLEVFGIGDPYAVEDPYVGFVEGNDLFEPVQISGKKVFRTRPQKLGFFNDQSFGGDKDPEALRIFALGGSTTAGRPYDWRVAFPKWLEVFGNAVSDRPLEVINAGGISYASYRITVLMKELVRYQPDVFVIYTGHNEFLEERTYSDIIHEPIWRRELRVWSNGLRFLNLARSLLGLTPETPVSGASQQPSADNGKAGDSGEPAVGRDLLASEVEAKLDVWNGLDLFERDLELQASVLTHFEHNLRQMIALAEAHDIPVVLVRPISNLKDFSPFKSQRSDGLTDAVIEQHDRHLERGVELLKGLEAADATTDSSTTDSAAADSAATDSVAEAAIEELRAATALDPLFAESAYRLGRALLASGREKLAAEAFARAKDLDVCPLRALEATDRIIREVASETSTPWVDLPEIIERRLQARLGHGIPGNEVLLDHVHPTLEAHQWIAQEVLGTLSGLGIVSLRPLEDTTREALIVEHLSTLDEAYYARRDLNLAKVLGWAGKFDEALEPLERAASQLYDEPEVFRNLGIVYQKMGRIGDALQAHQRAVELGPAVAESQFNLGVVLAEVGQWQRSASALRKAIELKPDYPEASFNLAIALRELGDSAAAEQMLEKASAGGWTHPGLGRQHALITVHKAQAESREGRFAEAQTLYEQALNQLKGAPKATSDAASRAVVARIHNDLGVLFGRQNRLEEAEGELLKAIEISPSFAEAHFNLALIYGNGGRLEESLERLQTALELEPENPRFKTALARLQRALAQ